jgi:membrane protein EpsK
MTAVSGAQASKNLGANIAYFAINIVIGIFLTPFFIETLGVAAYGVIPLATSLIGYIGLLTNSLNSAVSRHLTIDMQRSNVEEANRTFNSAFFGVTKVILAMVPIILIVSLFAPSLFGVPSENALDATWLFVGIGLAFLIRSWSSGLTVTLYASNRLDLINIINLTNVVVQVGFIVALFTISGPSLARIGLSYLLGAAIATAATIVMYRKMNETLSIKYGCYDSNKFREIAQMGGWIIINEIGALLLLNIDLIVVNYLYGNTVGGEYAIAYQWVGLLRGLASTFISILGPIILIAYADRQQERIIALSKSAVKLTGIGIALPVGLLCGFAPLILTLWVGAEFADLAPLMILLTSHLVINTAVIPLFQINVAFYKVRLPAIVTLITGAGNVILAFILATYVGWGVYGIASAGLITLTLKNIVFTPIYASMVLGVPKSTFYPAVIPGAMATVLVATMSLILSIFVSMDSIVILILTSGAITTVYALFTWKVLMNESERSIIPLNTRLS